MAEKRQVETSYVTKDKTTGKEVVKLDSLFRSLIQRCMGKALDYGRISGMSDRSLTQYERSIKDDFYTIIDDGTKILKIYGYLEDEDNK